MNTQKHVFYGAEGRYVAEADFDRVTAERDALQQLLNARDDEVCQQENIRANLLKALEMVAGLYSYESSSGENSMKLYDARSIALLAIAEAKGEQQ